MAEANPPAALGETPADMAVELFVLEPAGRRDEEM